MNKLSQKRLVDRLMDAYVSWREACIRVSNAYGSWAGGAGLGDESAFEWYMAALEQEERTAEVYAGGPACGPTRLARARRCQTTSRGGVASWLATRPPGW
jgi:hypothetical protein